MGNGIPMNHKNMKLDEVARLVLKLQEDIEGSTHHARINQLEDRAKDYAEPLLRELERRLGVLETLLDVDKKDDS